MKPNVNLETAVIKKFIEKTKQERYIQFVSSSKNRHKFINDLSHFNFFKWDLLDPVKGNEEQTIFDALRRNAVVDTTCYVISENREIDAKTLDIKDAIRETVGYGMGTILVFGAADIIFFEGETINTRFISRKIIQLK